MNCDLNQDQMITILSQRSKLTGMKSKREAVTRSEAFALTAIPSILYHVYLRRFIFTSVSKFWTRDKNINYLAYLGSIFIKHIVAKFEMLVNLGLHTKFMTHGTVSLFIRDGPFYEPQYDIRYFRIE